MWYLIIYAVFLITLEIILFLKIKQDFSFCYKYFRKIIKNILNKRIIKSKHGSIFYLIFIKGIFNYNFRIILKLLISIIPLIMLFLLYGYNEIFYLVLSFKFQLMLLLIMLIYFKLLRKKLLRVIKSY